MTLVFLSDSTCVEVGMPLSDVLDHLEALNYARSRPYFTRFPRAEGNGYHYINPDQIVRIARA